GLRRAAEVSAPVGDLVFTFADSVQVNGPIDTAYQFIDEADRWPVRLPHVRRLDLRVDEAGVQHMVMDTVAPDGATHTTSSVRVCMDGTQIVYKQIEVPALLTGHSGRWIFATEGGTTTITSEHTVCMNADAVEKVLGAGTNLVAAKTFVRDALGGNSRITLQHAKEFSEAGGVRLVRR
ncbi:MAG TPA: aromatase/cyclase, partial [Pseudonocardiaceae bacterium]